MSVQSALIAAGVRSAVARREAPLAAEAMRERGITTRQRSAMFLAQVLHESGGLRWFAELASGDAYEGRRDLGNVRPGDGRRYKGRGPIQLTGRTNYQWAAKELGLPLVSQPELAARHDVGWRIAALYWQSRNLNRLADQGDFAAITRRINGGMRGWPDRQRYLHLIARCDTRPGVALTPAEEELVREYDRLKRQDRDLSRRAELRREMRRARKRIWRAAQDTGWDRLDRRARYASLRARS